MDDFDNELGSLQLDLDFKKLPLRESAVRIVKLSPWVGVKAGSTVTERRPASAAGPGEVISGPGTVVVGP